MKRQDIYSTCVPSSISSIGVVVQELIHCLQYNFGEVNDNTIFELKVILNEILLNAVKHGNGEDVNKFVKVEAGVSQKNMMFITVEDEGLGYDFRDICSCRKPYCEVTDPFDISENGRGIMIIRSLCDHVKVNAKGNRIIIAKSLVKV